MSKELGIGSWVIGASADSEGYVGIIVQHHPVVTDGWDVKMEIWSDYLDPQPKTKLMTIKEWPQETSSWQTTKRLFGGTPSKKDRKLQRAYIVWIFSDEAIW